MSNPNLTSCILLEEILDNLLEFPPMNSRNFGYAIRYNKYKEQNIITQLLAEFYAPNVPPPQHITKISETMYLRHSKIAAILILVVLPNCLPSTG
jgi:hypothetical protein